MMPTEWSKRQSANHILQKRMVRASYLLRLTLPGNVTKGRLPHCLAGARQVMGQADLGYIAGQCQPEQVAGAYHAFLQDVVGALPF